MAVNAIKKFLFNERLEQQLLIERLERENYEKDKILRKICNTGLRFCGMAFRQAHQWTVADRERDYALAKRQRGVIMGMLDQNGRLLRMGWNKLLEADKSRKAMMKNRLKFVIKCLTDADAKLIGAAYNEMKARMLMLNGVGMGDAAMKKITFVKR